VTFEDWARRLGVTQEAADACLALPTPDEARAALELLKAEAKRRYRAYARQLHPDLGGDGEALKSLNAAWTIIEGLELVFPKEPDPVIEEWVPRAPTPSVTVIGNWIRLS
jgi:hypothetical protein